MMTGRSSQVCSHKQEELGKTAVSQTESLRRHVGEFYCSFESVGVLFAHMNALDRLGHLI